MIWAKLTGEESAYECKQSLKHGYAACAPGRIRTNADRQGSSNVLKRRMSQGERLRSKRAVMLLEANFDEYASDVRGA